VTPNGAAACSSSAGRSLGAIDGPDPGAALGDGRPGRQALERAGLHAPEREAQQLQEAFISVISHELRTPITTILAGSRLLRRQLDPAASR
jgi:signal transduction histidine kinase